MVINMFLATVAAIGLASAASAAVTGGAVTGGTAFTNGGVFQLIAAPAMTGNNNQQTNDLWAWDEQQNVILGGNLATDLGLDPILAGTRISSHGITFDPVQNRTLIGSVTFSSNIIAVITSRGNLIASDFLGVGTIYNSPAARGLETGDFNNTSFAGNVLTIGGWTASNPGDNIRVITAGAIPEPATWAMLIAGFGLVGFAARRRRAIATA